MASDALLSPPPSGSQASFGESQPPAYSQRSGALMRASDESSSEEDNERDRPAPGATARYATYCYPSSSHQRYLKSKAVYVPPPRYTAQARSWSRHEEVPQNPDAPQENQLNSTTSWPALSMRANGFLERVWGTSAPSGRGGVKSSRSIGGIFRAAQTESSSSRV
ncbi:hypothetical protein FRC12_019789 [Ceratobasidium sp. 428]|nr:hypothetical protein FRC12_019789 [Ceratobasidium sp. 428]